MVIINMDMPKSCANCRMVDDEFMYCHGKEVTHQKSDWLEVAKYVDNKTKPDWCHLKEYKPKE